MASTTAPRPLPEDGGEQKKSKSEGKLGAFLGVFTPTLLTILGVIMYLRFGWVLGNVGLALALVIVVLGNVITFLTTLSFSAIATNTQVGGGGAYFMLSRSLGLEIGGAIGLPLYLSQVLSVTLYAYGLTEAFRHVLPWLPVRPTVIVIILLVGVLSLKGAGIALRSQLPVMGLVAISLVALGAGVFLETPTSVVAGDVPLPSDDSPGVPFWTVFAVFFPAVTGVMAGLGLSGELRDARTAIPRGSIAAALSGFAVYLVVMVLLFFGAPADVLKQDQMVWTQIAVLGPVLVLPGLWGAIFSSAVGSMLAAPRTLEALAADHAHRGRLLRVFAGEGDAPPLMGTGISLLIAIGAVFLGDLNAVAEVVSMTFLTVYGSVNLVSALETLSGDSSWRPKIRIHWSLSLAGAVGCFAVIFLINARAGVAALALELALWLFFQRLNFNAQWGDMRRDIYEALIRWALIKLWHRPMTARNWRPHMLIFADSVERRLEAVRFGNWFCQNRGVVTICELIVGDILDESLEPAKRAKEVARCLDGEGIIAFGEVNVVPSLDQGIIDVTQANGVAGMQCNTILIGWPSDAQRGTEILRILQRLEKVNKSVILSKVRPGRLARERYRRRIHIWWGGLQRNGDLMLLLAHLLSRNPEWRNADIQLLSIASNETTRQDTEAQLQKILPETRIEAGTRVVIKDKDLSIHDIILRESAAADVVFLGLAVPETGKEAAYADRINELAEGLPTVFFVKNSSLFVGELV